MKSAVSKKRIVEVFQLLKRHNEFVWNGYLVRRDPTWRGAASFGYWPVTITRDGTEPWSGSINNAIKALHFTMNRKGFIQHDL